MEFAKLADVFEKMEKTKARLELTAELAALFAQAKPAEMRHLVYLLQGVVAPEFTGIELGMGDKLAAQAISRVSGSGIKEIEARYRKQGDLGDAAETLLAKKAQLRLAAEPLTTQKVRDNFYRIATASGGGSQDAKINLLAELLANAQPREAKMVVRFVQGRLRLGFAGPTILDALSTLVAQDKSLRPMLERAFNLRSDLGLIAEMVVEGKMAELDKLTPTPGTPIRPALAERLLTAQQILEKIGPCAVEGKYDGFRLQVHKRGQAVELFSRKQEPMTAMFPDLVLAVQKEFKARDAVFEGEAIAFDEQKNRFQPFQVTIQRRRKHGVSQKATEIPLRLYAFELLYADGKDYTMEPYHERRKTLAALIRNDAKTLRLSDAIHADKPEQLQAFFEQCLERGLEGIIAKDEKAPYIAGARKFAWIKLKRSYGKLTDTFDLVVIGYYKGKGKRTQFEFGGLLTAVYDDANERFRSIARLGTGFSEEQMKELHTRLEALKIAQRPADVDSEVEADVWVRPQMVVEVNADEITQSPMHSAGKREGGDGLALRFPRLVGIREDKKPQDATTEEEVRELYELQQQR